MPRTWDAVVVGAGPNGLAAAIEIAGSGFHVLVLERADVIGGGTRTSGATLPRFLHDDCSAIHPLAVLSPFFQRWPLADHGLEWLSSSVSVAHPLNAGPTPLLVRSPVETGARLGVDARRWARLVAPYVPSHRGDHDDGRNRTLDLFADLLDVPLSIPKGLTTLVRFTASGVRSASSAATSWFRGRSARALFAGCAAHSVLPLEKAGTAGFGLLFAVSAHTVDWPCAKGGAGSISTAMARLLRSLGGQIEVGCHVGRLRDLPKARVTLFDVAPTTFIALCGDELPSSYVRRLQRYRYGPGAFKVDWALDGPIPWRDPLVGRAATVHVGGTLEEIAASELDAWEGRVSDAPFLILCQQSALDGTRAPEGKHTGYAYCHVPAGCPVDMTDRIERQVERFAPGFRDRVLARRTLTPADFQRMNPNYVGGAITGGVADIRQILARPVLRWNPHGTPNPRYFLCSASTPPGGGVHGMCGFHAARAALRRLRKE